MEASNIVLPSDIASFWHKYQHEDDYKNNILLYKCIIQGTIIDPTRILDTDDPIPLGNHEYINFLYTTHGSLYAYVYSNIDHDHKQIDELYHLIKSRQDRQLYPVPFYHARVVPEAMRTLLQICGLLKGSDELEQDFLDAQTARIYQLHNRFRAIAPKPATPQPAPQLQQAAYPIPRVQKIRVPSQDHYASDSRDNRYPSSPTAPTDLNLPVANNLHQTTLPPNCLPFQYLLPQDVQEKLAQRSLELCISNSHDRTAMEQQNYQQYHEAINGLNSTHYQILNETELVTSDRKQIMVVFLTSKRHELIACLCTHNTEQTTLLECYQLDQSAENGYFYPTPLYSIQQQTYFPAMLEMCGHLCDELAKTHISLTTIQAQMQEKQTYIQNLYDLAAELNQAKDPTRQRVKNAKVALPSPLPKKLTAEEKQTVLQQKWIDVYELAEGTEKGGNENIATAMSKIMYNPTFQQRLIHDPQWDPIFTKLYSYDEATCHLMLQTVNQYIINQFDGNDYAIFINKEPNGSERAAKRATHYLLPAFQAAVAKIQSRPGVARLHDV